MKRATLIVNQREITEPELQAWRDEAIDTWHKAEKSILKTKITQGNAEVTIKSCNARLRLLWLMSNSQ